MGTRIVTLQRQARELGRLRTGYTDTSGSKPRPVRSATWIVTSHAEHYVQAAADVWGGKVEKWQPLGSGAPQWRAVTDTPSLDAILPPGDPMSQSYEIWTKGGAQRRCDGMTETLADEPCYCRARWGDNFHEVAPKIAPKDAPAEAACKITTRLNVILPEMPDIGAWRVETHSFYSANEMAAAVDVLKGSIGADALIPVRLRIEQRTRVAQGKTKQFPVVAVELRGSTAGQVLSGSAQSVPVGNGPAAAVDAPAARPAVAGSQAPAIEAPAVPTAEDFLIRARKVHTFDEFKTIWDEAAAADISPSKAQSDEMTRIGKDLKASVDTPPPAETGQPAAVSDVDVLWQAIVARWPRGMTELQKVFKGAMGTEHNIATENELAAFLKIVDEGRYDAQVTAAVAGLDDQAPF